MRADEMTMGDVFQANGYATGMFGKWHLGDNYPFYPHERGFRESFYHGGGGVTQQPDYWGNDYFDDTYFRNGIPEKCEGYCTDIWFANAMQFIRNHKDEPFLCYLATNAPHGPLYVAEEYWKPYFEMGMSENLARFYGMITNIDDNLGDLTALLEEEGLTENTILIFMTDNGTATGASGVPGKEGWLEPPDGQKRWIGYNAGMRGKKGSHYDGGHRVPLYIRWPKGDLNKGTVEEITAHVDLLPTLIELCDLEKPEGGYPFDGTSIVPLLEAANGASSPEWPDRILFVERNRQDFPPKWRWNAVMTDRWRLIEDRELYDIQADPSQQKNVIDEHPEVAKRLHDAYEKRWSAMSKRFGDYSWTIVGSPKDNPTTIYSHDWHPTEGRVPWNQNQVKSMPPWNGYWALKADRSGKYRVSLMHQPQVAQFPIQADHAELKLGKSVETLGEMASLEKSVPAEATKVDFEVEIPEGTFFIQSWLMDSEKDVTRGAYYLEIEYLGRN